MLVLTAGNGNLKTRGNTHLWGQPMVLNEEFLTKINQQMEKNKKELSSLKKKSKSPKKSPKNGGSKIQNTHELIKALGPHLSSSCHSALTTKIAATQLVFSDKTSKLNQSEVIIQFMFFTTLSNQRCL